MRKLCYINSVVYIRIYIYIFFYTCSAQHVDQCHLLASDVSYRYHFIMTYLFAEIIIFYLIKSH